jgi:hypothetical protein
MSIARFPHDELFWENGKAVFRKLVGIHGNSIERVEKKNPNTYTIDTGDMFQGSELSVETTGSGLCTHFKCIRLQLVLPGNWEVIWGRRDANTVRLTKCKNMYKYVPRFR